MTGTRAFATRALRVGVVVLPILAAGVCLGMGHFGEKRVSPPPHRVRGIADTAPAVTEARLPEESVPAPLVEETGRTLPVLSAGDLARTWPELTHLPLDEAVAHYDRTSRLAGWTLAPALMQRMKGANATGALRAYTQDGRLRLVIIGEPASERTTARPVTVFESHFRGTGN